MNSLGRIPQQATMFVIIYLSTFSVMAENYFVITHQRNVHLSALIKKILMQ